MSDTRQRCIEIFVAVFGVDADSVNDDSSPDSIPEWDSLAHVQMVLKLEKTFGISIPPDDAIEFETFGAIYSWIENACQ